MAAELKMDPLTIFVANESHHVTNTIKLGQNWSIYWTVHNRGDEAAPAHTEVLTIAAKDGQSGSRDFRAHVPELPANAGMDSAHVVTFNFGSAETFTAGSYVALGKLHEGGGGETHVDFELED